MSKHFIAVCDALEFWDMTWEEVKGALGAGFDMMKPYLGPKVCYSHRWFGEKFVKDPLMAAFDVVYPPQKWYDSKMLNTFKSGLKLDPETGIYVYNYFTTTGLQLEPKDWHFAKFFAGDPLDGRGEPFRLNYSHYDIQVLSTEVERIPESLLEVGEAKTWKTASDFQLG